MIQVVYHRKYHRVTVNGHANSGEFGRDLVCAAASAIAVTLGENVEAMKRSGHVRAGTVSYERGAALVCCTPASRYNNIVTVIFDAVCMGFDRLAKEYPDFIAYEVRG